MTGALEDFQRRSSKQSGELGLKIVVCRDKAHQKCSLNGDATLLHPLCTKVWRGPLHNVDIDGMVRQRWGTVA